jgi:choline dehydrogenase-like flavoprotein
MFIDAGELSKGEILETEICVIGAGAAGIAIARELGGRDFRVLLLESGGFDFDEQTQELYRAESIGAHDGKIDDMRLRYFGGTTNHWAGNCRPLDALDFTPRPWASPEGWPFARAELVPFYRRAEALLEIAPFDYETAAWDGGGQGPPLPFAPERLLTSQYQVNPVRFGTAFRDDIRRAANVTACLHANVVEIEIDDAVKQVTGLRVAAPGGKAFGVRARLYVLAAGGVENVRLLLNSDRVQRGGLANGNDLVGQFFMEHMVQASGRLLPLDPYIPMRLYAYDQRSYGVLTLPEEIVRGEQLVNLTIALQRNAAPEAAGVTSLKAIMGALGEGKAPDPFADHVWNVITDIDDVAAAAYRKLLGQRRPLSFVRFFNRAEAIPDRQSRVTLSRQRDRLGQRRVRLDWRPGNGELPSIRRAHEIAALEAGRTGVGRVQVELEGEKPERTHAWAVSGHHMGTTRMHANPKRGVVDANCRVHGMANLYVAGSSVFPTAGCSNPTLTIIALALRIADRIKLSIGNGR